MEENAKSKSERLIETYLRQLKAVIDVLTLGGKYLSIKQFFKLKNLEDIKITD